MSSQAVVRICNQALRLIGAEPIISLDENTKTAKLCAVIYPAARDEALSSHPWGCAIVRQQLAGKPVADEATGFQYRYQLPEDPRCLRVVDFAGAPYARWEQEGGSIFTDEHAVILRYVGSLEDPSGFDALLVKAITYRMAADLVVSLKGERDLSLEQLYLMQLQAAQGIDNRTRRSNPRGDVRWDRARWGGSR